MKRLILALIASALVAPALSAQVRVKGYTRSDGTYVAPHYRSSPNSTTTDNYSTKGNVNPYTGEVGTRNPYYTPPASSSYRSPSTTETKKAPETCYLYCPN